MSRPVGNSAAESGDPQSPAVRGLQRAYPRGPFGSPLQLSSAVICGAAAVSSLVKYSLETVLRLLIFGVSVLFLIPQVGRAALALVRYARIASLALSCFLIATPGLEWAFLKRVP